MSCFFGHKKKYVGVEDVIWRGEYGNLDVKCPHGFQFLSFCDVCKTTGQIARWTCQCGKMGETYIKRGEGVFMVSFGSLVPDEKRWANWQSHSPIIGKPQS